MNSTSYASVSSDLADAAAAVSAAKSLMDQGNIVDLSGLEKHVEHVCNGILALPRDERDSVRPRLVALIDSLNDLTSALSGQHEALAGQLRELGSRHKALSAYAPHRTGRQR